MESQLLDGKVLALLEAVQQGALTPGAAALQLRERSAGYQQARVMSKACACSRDQPRHGGAFSSAYRGGA